MHLPPEFAVANGPLACPLDTLPLEKQPQGKLRASPAHEAPAPAPSTANTAAAIPALAMIFEQLAYGVLIVNAHGVIAHANQSARTELQNSPYLGRNGARVEATLPLEHSALQAALASAQCGERSVLHFGAGAQPLTVAVVPLQTQGQMQCDTIALLFARAAVCDSLMLHHFARSHKLTAMEECVLRLLCRELDQSEIAQELGVAVSTIRSHIKNIATKTGCHGMRALLARLSLLPPLMPQVQGQPDVFSPPAMH